MWGALVIVAAAHAGDGLPPPAAYGEGNAFAFAGIVELGPGGGLGASGDIGVTWIAHVHAEVGLGVHDPIFTSTEPHRFGALTRLNLEAGYPIPVSRRTLLAPGGALDRRGPVLGSARCEDDGPCQSSSAALSLGVGFLTHPVSDRTDYVSAFWGLGFFVIGDVGAPLMRMRAEWGHTSGLYTAFEVSGRYDTTLMVGAHL